MFVCIDPKVRMIHAPSMLYPVLVTKTHSFAAAASPNLRTVGELGYNKGEHGGEPPGRRHHVQSGRTDMTFRENSVISSLSDEHT